MENHKNQYSEEYDVGSSTEGGSKDSKQTPQSMAKEEEEKEKDGKKRYTSGKPRRETIRARITHD